MPKQVEIGLRRWHHTYVTPWWGYLLFAAVAVQGGREMVANARMYHLPTWRLVVSLGATAFIALVAGLFLFPMMLSAYRTSEPESPTLLTLGQMFGAIARHVVRRKYEIVGVSLMYVVLELIGALLA